MELKQITDRLKQLGHEIKIEEEIALNFVKKRVEEHVLNFCNVTEIPDGVENHIIDRICGEYLHELNNLGKLTEFDTNRCIEQIELGDTNVKFKGSSQEDRINMIISALIGRLDGELLCYRQIKW